MQSVGRRYTSSCVNGFRSAVTAVCRLYDTISLGQARVCSVFRDIFRRGVFAVPCDSTGRETCVRSTVVQGRGGGVDFEISVYALPRGGGSENMLCKH